MFRALIWRFYRRTGRHALPWRKTRNPYHVAVSEMMLQQTQVARVRMFYPKFLKRFPSFRALAHASRREVLTEWQGLGYNRRAVALHRLAHEVVAKYKGKLPRDLTLLLDLPGIGRATAGSILAFAFNIPTPFIETNIRRVFIYHFFPRKKRVTEGEILALVHNTLDRENPREWYSALMDYGAWLAKQTKNPNRKYVRYRRQPKFEGSSRELRGKIVRYFLQHPRANAHTIAHTLKEPLPRVAKTLAILKREGIIKK